MTGDSTTGLMEAHDERIPRYLFPETAARALGIAADYENWRSGPAGEMMMFEDAQPTEGRAFCRTLLAQRGAR